MGIECLEVLLPIKYRTEILEAFSLINYGDRASGGFVSTKIEDMVSGGLG